MADALSVVPAAVLRNLSDKLYEKRKLAAYEVEGIVRQLTAVGDHDKITAVINLLTHEYTYSPQTNHRKGGLIGLAAATVGLSAEAAQHLEFSLEQKGLTFIGLDRPLLHVKGSDEFRPFIQVVRGEFIFHFNKIFDALCKLSADSDPNVQSTAHLLDRLVKIRKMEGQTEALLQFLELPYVLDQSEPAQSLPSSISRGLFNMLSDSSHEIRQQADSALSEFLQEIKNSPSVDYGRMAEILVQRAASPDEFTRWTAITWINEFVKLGGDQLVPYYADILGAILPCIADKEEKIRVVARETNEELRAIKADPTEGFDVGAILSIAKRELSNEHEATRIEALHWISTLLSRHRSEVLSFLNDILDTLLKSLSDPSDQVVLLVLEVHAAIAKDEYNFRQLVVFLVHKFRMDNALLERRGALIIRRLCVLLDAERVYRELSKILEGEADLDFASTMVQALNLILLTSSELSDIRNLLKLSLVNAAGKDFFLSLYPSWSHSSMAIISLCLLAQASPIICYAMLTIVAYQHASSVIQSLTEEDINVIFLVQLDKFIHLLETPIFAYLRLQLLEPGRYTWLLKALYGLIMLLPQQSTAFKILRTRLKTVPSYSFNKEQIQRTSSGDPSTHTDYMSTGLQFSEDGIMDGDSHNGINFESWLQRFQQMQQQHRLHSKSQARARNISISTKEVKEIQKPEEVRGPSPGPEISRPPSRSSRKGPGQLHL
ncbi:protein VAC14 [Tanacetum coccineum]|uniref:Protein VAC14 n=1 Tax=Tanacetum coccineum TaxID=301880 RepID=A0ABQ5AXY9_9ASTR